jgi:hypothetical protein
VSVVRCKHCQVHIQWLATKFKSRLPFNYKEVVKADLSPEQQAWIPGLWPVGPGGTEIAVMAPLGHYGPAKQDSVKLVYLVHTCEVSWPEPGGPVHATLTPTRT